MTEYWVNDNGVDRPMTPEEIAEMERMEAMYPPPASSDSDRITALEQELLSFKASYEKGVDEA